MAIFELVPLGGRGCGTSRDKLDKSGQVRDKSGQVGQVRDKHGQVGTSWTSGTSWKQVNQLGISW